MKNFLETQKSMHLLVEALNKVCSFFIQPGNIVHVRYISEVGALTEWVASEMLPEQVYSEAALEEWARRNGFRQKRNEVEWRSLAYDAILEKGDLILFSDGSHRIVSEIVSNVEKTIGECMKFDCRIGKISRKREV